MILDLAMSPDCFVKRTNRNNTSKNPEVYLVLANAAAHVACHELGLCHLVVPTLKENNIPFSSMRRMGTGRSWGRKNKMTKIYCMNIFLKKRIGTTKKYTSNKKSLDKFRFQHLRHLCFIEYHQEVKYL